MATMSVNINKNVLTDGKHENVVTAPRSGMRKAKPPIRRKRYKSVVEMTRDLSDDPSFADELERTISGRRLVKTLLGFRAAQGLSQQDIADKLGRSQSRVSKFEASADDALRMGDLRAYAEALGLDVSIELVRKSGTVLDQA